MADRLIVGDLDNNETLIGSKMVEKQIQNLLALKLVVGQLVTVASKDISILTTRQTDRSTDRGTGRQTCMLTGRQTFYQISRQTGRHTPSD